MTKRNRNTKGTEWLRVLLGDESRKFLTNYLNAEFPAYDTLYNSLARLAEKADKIIVSEYEGQYQVSAVFNVEGRDTDVGVSGLGDTVDLAMLVCYSKCQFDLNWQFQVQSNEENISPKPRFS